MCCAQCRNLSKLRTGHLPTLKVRDLDICLLKKGILDIRLLVHGTFTYTKLENWTFAYTPNKSPGQLPIVQQRAPDICLLHQIFPLEIHVLLKNEHWTLAYIKTSHYEFINSTKMCTGHSPTEDKLRHIVS